MTDDGFAKPWEEATPKQVAHWVERQRQELDDHLAGVDRVLALTAMKGASPSRTRLDEQRALILLDRGVLETLWACHQRWQLAREGMGAFVETAEDPPHISIFFHNGAMESVADEIWGELQKTDANAEVVSDVTMIFDKMRETYEAKK